ncbi:ATP-binding protein [Actinocorallia aurantiaca]|uniref:Histidine kinase/HSP90-like ATPase domain-containing protein n=1 Tax=Actinocorallia aurantiaca TaxID=46204 RepID=A0ABP6G824_9ACTN
MSIVYLPHAPSSVSLARRSLNNDLLSWGVSEGVVDDAAVILSELLSNALRHARPLPGDEGGIKISWIRVGDTVELAVTDGGAATEPRKGEPALSSLGGRGLGIVEILSQSWGVRRDDQGSTVWAHLHAPSRYAFENSEDRGAETGAPVQNLRQVTR